MELFSEDPTYLAGGLGLLAAAFLIAMRVTQQGKYLVWAGTSLGLALAVVVVERVWVTDNERIERAVYDLGRAVEASNVSGVFEHMTPDVQLVVDGNPTPAGSTRNWIEQELKRARFDFLRISRLQANAGGQSRRGTAEFRVVASGSRHASVNDLNFGTLNSTWSLGFRETSPGVWKVNRITPVSFPSWGEIMSAVGNRHPQGERPHDPGAGPGRGDRRRVRPGVQIPGPGPGMTGPGAQAGRPGTL